jgi:hypothetical protein
MGATQENFTRHFRGRGKFSRLREQSNLHPQRFHPKEL